MKVASGDFDRSLQQLKEEILREATSGLFSSDYFQQLLATLRSFYETHRPMPAFSILISGQNLQELDINLVNTNLNGAIAERLQTNNLIQVNKCFAVEACSSIQLNETSEARAVYRKLSQNNCCLIYVSEEGIHHFFNGIESGKNYFLTDHDYKSYFKKKDINEIDSVLEEYKAQLKLVETYSKFFVTKTTLMRLFGASDYESNKNLLRNRPEHLFRDDFKAFLSARVKGTFNFNKELHLESEKRLDINTEDRDGNYYFFEIKWLGTSIHPDDNKIGQQYHDDDLKKGVNQTLEYIKELKETRKMVKFGCLTVFDARKEKTAIMLEPYEYVKEPLKPELIHFKTKTDFHVSNERPC